MDDVYESIMNNPEACREEGKRLFFNTEHNMDEKDSGLKLLSRAVQLRDPEAEYILGTLYISNILHAKSTNSIDYGLYLLCLSANKGFLPARTLLNRYCDARYKKDFDGIKNEVSNGPLTGFDGKMIKINKRGLLTPIDAILKYENGQNILTLSANVVFFDGECDMRDPEQFYNAVYDGFMEWSGDYEVFGGQKLKVVVELTSDDRAFDNVFVMPMSKEINEKVTDIWNKIGTEKIKNRVNNTIGMNRSFANIGLRKWSVRSRKIIMLQSDNGHFDEYEKIKHVAKHEFGHALGLGDLYPSTVDNYKGVDKGSYRELDSYYITDNIYNLVMCDHHGPISNNDIEMVVLAFSKNKYQNYQPVKVRDKISEALGKGN